MEIAKTTDEQVYQPTPIPQEILESMPKPPPPPAQQQQQPQTKTQPAKKKYDFELLTKLSDRERLIIKQSCAKLAELKLQRLKPNKDQSYEMLMADQERMMTDLFWQILSKNERLV